MNYCYNIITSQENIISSQIIDKVKAYYNSIKKEEEIGSSPLQKQNEGLGMMRKSQRLKDKA